MVPYYSVSIEEDSRTVNAIDENGAVIVSLIYEDHAELCSSDFQMSLRDAVVLASSEYPSMQGDDLLMVMWEEQMKLGGDVEKDMTRMLLEMVEREDLEKRREEEERDRQLAMELQMEEEKVALQDGERRKQGGNVWSRSNPWKTLCYTEEKEDMEGFPSLPVKHGCEKVSDFMPTGNILESMTVQRDAMCLYRDDTDEDIAQVMNDWKKASHISSQLDHLRLSAVEKDDRDFILSAAASAMGTGKKSGVSPQSLRKMMSSSPENDVEEEIIQEVDREKYSRKSIRKLVLDMIAAGWMPLRRGGGHYIYERCVKIPNAEPLKQILVLPSTPSSQKNIDRVYAKLIKYDREVAEKIVQTS